jgi:hypothetical protein
MLAESAASPGGQVGVRLMKLKFVAAAGLVALSTLAAAPVQAQTENWTVTQGTCGDWSGTWAMQHVGPGHWIGTSVITVKSRRCTGSAMGAQLTATVDFTTYVNRTWRAIDTNTQNGSHCQYSGSVNSDNNASGTYRCGGNGQLSNISIISPTAFYN